MSSKKKNGGSAPEVPIFLQKTYHMIDTSPPQIATWSSDGQTFIVKNTHLFETTIIPQFFKHSKFSSFVRQLNFYGFRKIRFENSLKIDLEREKTQRNFWRFKHENFRRGRKDLLREIKRSASSSSGSNGGGGNVAAAVSPNANTSNVTNTANNSPSSNNSTNNINYTPPPPPQEVTRLNTEVNTLKEQMQSMVTKMDDLTCLVKDMKVSPPPQSQSQVGGEEVSCGNKRKKTDDTTSMNMMTMMMPEGVPSSMMTNNNTEEVDVDIILPFPNDMSLEDAATTLLPDLTLSNPSGPSSLLPTPVLSRCSSLRMDVHVAPSAVGGEEDFVDELFHAFATDDTTLPPPQEQQQLQVEENPNKPDPQLMKRIEDSLSTIPKTMHEMVANRLIDAIAEGSSATAASTITTSSSGSCSGEGATIVCSPSSSSSGSVTSSSPNNNNESIDKENTLNRSSSSIIPEGTTTTAEAEKTSIPLPLAIATLKTILADYGLKVECGSSSEDANLHRRLSNKSLPLVPIHA
mmetsp:Transcript_12324/g.18917  ORF Transcript_12324/g.18917 Transcript_12324/m.18917 type:complete len:519 (-) Transcript_12324:415-1971(-)|eukprot:CAMPEP_0201738532 /NCGR_PEP_ID=MMETSP0593-20130828/45298_1 /ASSEMBLY_ACC=CAM_ASM_000672 /TAXON_ID=267983 /ORGANISM="Skeletonema japonicum, Strain CCMP2506" /LENGTH=518 /DNA_ID=CAMNT_0048232753 /DNA_START=291 /DNA_END=1847 /DNA_ORIENTATION=-